MNQAIVDNWNSVVEDNDETYILGDFAWVNEDGLKVLQQLKGNKYLILGNHDRLNAEMQKHFVWVKEIETINDGDKHVVMCHYPIAHWKNQDRGYIHLYGHIHQGRDARPFETYKKMYEDQGIMFKAYNVGCMMPYIDYTPRTLEEIIK